MAAIIIILTGVLSVAACYNFGVSLMVHNNYKQEAFKLAQETMVSLRKKEKIEKSDLLHALNEETVMKQLKRLGTSEYILEQLELICDDDVMVPMSEINEARRKATEELNAVRLAKFTPVRKQQHWRRDSLQIMKTLATVYNDPSLLSAVESERDFYYKMIKARADLFTKEAQECGLKMLPYIAGFFLSIPAKNPVAICDKLHANGYHNCEDSSRRLFLYLQFGY